MKLRTRTAIIGGGLMGCWTALMLRRRGLDCVVIEKGAVGAQAAGQNYGNIRLQARYRGQIPLALRSIGLYERMEELVGERCEFDPTGHLYAAQPGKEEKKVAECARDAQDHGIAAEVLDAAEMRRRWPWLRGPYALGSWSARDAVANPRLVTPAVARRAKAMGAQVFEGVSVTGIERGNDTFRIATSGGLRVEADQVVNVAGAWALGVAAMFGETAPLFAGGPPQFVTEPLPYFIGPSVQAVDGSVIFRQVRRGNIVVAGYPRGASDIVAIRAPVDPRKTINTMAKLVEAVPALSGARLLRVWSGIEGYLPDMLPVLGPSRTTPGLWHAFGFCGHGFALGPGVGDVLADLVETGSTETPIADFSIGRFADGSVAETAHLRAEFDSAMLPTTAAR